VVPEEDMPFLEDGTPVDIILNPLGVPGRMNIGQILETHLGWAANRLGFRAITPVFDGASESEIEAELARAWLIDKAWNEMGRRAWEWLDEHDYDPEALRDDREATTLYLQAVAGKRFDFDMLTSDINFARRAALIIWLEQLGRKSGEGIVLEDDTLQGEERRQADDNAIRFCLQTWLQDHGDNGKSRDDEALVAKATKMMGKINRPVPTLGKMVVRDGRTGEPYERAVTVGIIHMLKLHHLVEDKVHARSTGPYSLVTQQPLGGKAQFGGQRFGEMEVWALEAYGAAHTLQEMLTVKSDDVLGRVKTYESIVKGEPIEDPGIPASFRVLVKEMQSLGLAVEAETDTGEMIQFGKDEGRKRAPRLGGIGLLDFGRRGS
jgi:DNA-directed RNA polymerase subunit beta